MLLHIIKKDNDEIELKIKTSKSGFISTSDQSKYTLMKLNLILYIRNFEHFKVKDKNDYYDDEDAKNIT